MPRLNQPIRKSAAIFVRTSANGVDTFRREPYNVISLDYGDGTDVKTFIEPTCGRPLASSEREEVYSEVRIYDSPPYPAVQIGYAR